MIASHRVLVSLGLYSLLALMPQPSAAQGIFFPFFGLRGPPSARPPDNVPRIPRMPRPPVAPAVPGAPGTTALEGAPPPYEGELSRLAEILGALHYLRPLCGAPEGARWRGEMQALIEAEQPSAGRRDRLIASFNRGFHSYGQSYRSCTPAASLAIHRYLDEGARLSREIATRYGN
jgi:uncharacterized protein (TIGR02301 family)